MLKWVKIRVFRCRCTGASSTFDSRADRDALLAPRLMVENIQQMPFYEADHTVKMQKFGRQLEMAASICLHPPLPPFSSFLPFPSSLSGTPSLYWRPRSPL